MRFSNVSKTSITKVVVIWRDYHKTDGFVDDDVDDEINIDDEFEEIEEEDFDDNNESGF